MLVRPRIYIFKSFVTDPWSPNLWAMAMTKENVRCAAASVLWHLLATAISLKTLGKLPTEPWVTSRPMMGSGEGNKSCKHGFLYFLPAMIKHEWIGQIHAFPKWCVDVEAGSHWRWVQSSKNELWERSHGWYSSIHHFRTNPYNPPPVNPVCTVRSYDMLMQTYATINGVNHAWWNCTASSQMVDTDASKKHENILQPPQNDRMSHNDNRVWIQYVWLSWIVGSPHSLFLIIISIFFVTVGIDHVVWLLGIASSSITTLPAVGKGSIIPCNFPPIIRIASSPF